MCRFSTVAPESETNPKRYLASASDDKTIRIWDIFDEKLAGPNSRARTPAAGSVSKNLNSPAVSSNGRGSKQAASDDGRLGDSSNERVKVEPYLVKKLEGHDDDVTHVAWSPKGLQSDGKRLLVRWIGT
jgi:WD40 repeat protein